MSPTNGTTAKSHKIEGKNKKSLHHKQQETLNQQRANPQTQPQFSMQSVQQPNSTTSSNRRAHQKGSSGHNKVTNPVIDMPVETTNMCSSLDDFSKRAQELKQDINSALEKQASHQIIDQPIEVVKLKNDILKLSGLKEETIISDDQEKSLDGSAVKFASEISNDSTDTKDVLSGQVIESQSNIAHLNIDEQTDESNKDSKSGKELNDQSSHEKSEKNSSPNHQESPIVLDENVAKSELINVIEKPNSSLVQTLNKLTLEEEKSPKLCRANQRKQNSKRQSSTTQDTKPIDTLKEKNDIVDSFEPLNAKLDTDSKFVALVSSLQKHFNDAPHLLEPICRKLVNLSEQNGQLAINCEQYQSENQKLLTVKQKLENLCRELQKSNNAIRIESLDLIKVEQSKAKEQTTKIQSTLSGVIKLFDENQQRNMNLRQENQDLQTKLKSLLDHCDNWEKSVEAALRQRDIENRLIKTELAKANLLKNEEKEKFLSEKQELLQILSMMQEQQHRIEGQEAKLRSDLSSYASKYDECQAVISKGMNRFQTESKRMLKQIERSKQDYKVLLSKYESSNRRMAQLLEEKQYWDKAMGLANKKVETLEKLCRALREQKLQVKSDAMVTQKPSKSKSANKNLKCVNNQADNNKKLPTLNPIDDSKTATEQAYTETANDVEENEVKNDSYFNLTKEEHESEEGIEQETPDKMNDNKPIDLTSSALNMKENPEQFTFIA